MPDLPCSTLSGPLSLRYIGPGRCSLAKYKPYSQHECLDKESSEAERNLDNLDELFDHYYVKQVASQQKQT